MDFNNLPAEQQAQDRDPQYVFMMGVLKQFVDRMYAIDPHAMRRFMADGRSHVLRTLRRTFGDFVLKVEHVELRLRDEDYDAMYTRLCGVVSGRPIQSDEVILS